ncbi:flagellar protein FlhE [Erwinia sp. E602]|uniref:flagellar protein FlhE n=1 Tax=Erwinia sp. E602 TaxID=2675378 RepID=UPI00353040F4
MRGFHRDGVEPLTSTLARRSLWIGVLLLVPGLCQAVASSWSASDIGPGIGNRGVQASSRPLSPRQPVQGAINQIAWRYQLASPAPAGLQVKLCSSSRCTPLEGGSGVTSGLTNVAAGDTLRFVYLVEGKGRLFPPLRVVSNGVMVNYQ